MNVCENCLLLAVRLQLVLEEKETIQEELRAIRSSWRPLRNMGNSMMMCTGTWW